MFTKTFVSLSSAKKVAYLAVFAAIAVAVNAFSIDLTAALKLSFTATVGYFSGALFGPVGGLAVMLVGDTIGCFISGYAPNPIISVGTVMLGVIPGLIMTYMRGNMILKSIVSYILCFFVTTAFLNTLGVYLMAARDVSFWSYMLTRLPVQVPVMAINAVVSVLLAKLLNRANTRFKIS